MGYSYVSVMYRLCIGYVSVMCRLCVGRYSEQDGFFVGVIKAVKSNLLENKNKKFANIRKNLYLCGKFHELRILNYEI